MKLVEICKIRYTIYMELNFNNIYQNLSAIFKDGIIDLKKINSFDPWAIGLICLKAIENKDNSSRNILFSENTDANQYLKQIGLDEIMKKFTYDDSCLSQFESMEINEQNNFNIHRILYSRFRDEFNAYLESTIRKMFRDFGMKETDEQKATVLVGELGNNVFDHNEGLWPTDIRGAIILAQKDTKVKKIELVVADPGIGFLNSLRGIPEPPVTDIDAIKLGLKGTTGRVGERRGNGLPLILDWTINQFNGIVKIHSGNGLVIVDKNKQETKSVNKIVGTLAGFMVLYN